MFKKKYLLIIIFLIFIILLFFVFRFSKSNYDVLNKILKGKYDTYSYWINYPYFNINTIDNYVDDYLNDSIHEIDYYDNTSLFIDYDYHIEDNNINIVFYEYITKFNILKHNIYEINYDIKLDKISKIRKDYENSTYDFLDSGVGNKKLVAFTFDDGPSYNTIKIINTLVKYNSKATFFLIGNKVDNYPKTLDMLVKTGMDIGNHTYSHKVLTKLSESEIEKEINLTNEKIYALTGITPTFLRPSYGALNKRIKKLSKMPIIIWNLDTLDWKNHNSVKIKEKILKYVSDGDIILMHDTYTATANAVEMVIPELIKEGYMIVSVKELFYYKGVSPKLGIGYGFIE